MASVEIEKDKKKALGRGLASLIPDLGGGQAKAAKREFFHCDIEKIVPSTYQPRKIFDSHALEELIASIKAHGIIQPLVVRMRDGRYELIAGERRWRAAQKAGLKRVPVVVKDIKEDVSSLEMAIIENVQREDLNCIEEAIAYQQLMDEFQMSQEDIAAKVGKSRATISNTVRLLKLPSVIREDITASRLTMGHARALLSLESTEDQLALRELVVKRKFSVRDTEKRVNEILSEGKESTREAKPMDVHLKALEDEFRQLYGTKVRIVGNEKRGFIQFTYANKDDLMRLADELKGDDVSTQA